MVLKSYCGTRCSTLLLTLAFGSLLNAAPRLSLTQTALSLTVATGQNAPAQSVDASNSGDGFLTLQTASSVPWLVPAIGASHGCPLGGTCIPVQIAVNSSSLTKGIYTGTVTVSDPNAVDAPQFITVTVAVGGSIPDNLEFFVPPGGSATSSFVPAGRISTTVSAPWLSVAITGGGSFAFNLPYIVTASAGTMATGNYNATIGVSSTAAPQDNKSIAVVLHITSQPVLRTSPGSLQLRSVQGGAKQTVGVAVTNANSGTLTVSGVTAAAASGTWLSAQTVSGGVSVTADPAGLTPNTYQGTVTIASNAANSSVVIPVQLTVAATGPPLASVGGVVNNGTFGGGESLAPGDIVAVFGDQFLSGDAQQAGSLPLPNVLGGTQVLVNGQPAPVYYVSAGQINFQIPIDAQSGPGTLRVVRNGQQGNAVFINITDRDPRFILFNGPYAIMTTPQGALTGIPTHPVTAGDVVIIYAIGLGVTTPIVPSGTASPASPLAVAPATQICFGTPTPFKPPACYDVGFSGLTPNFVGLFQVNATIPSGLTAGDVPFFFTVAGIPSNNVQLAVQ